MLSSVRNLSTTFERLSAAIAVFDLTGSRKYRSLLIMRKLYLRESRRSTTWGCMRCQKSIVRFVDIGDIGEQNFEKEWIDKINIEPGFVFRNAAACAILSRSGETGRECGDLRLRL